MTLGELKAHVDELISYYGTDIQLVAYSEPGDVRVSNLELAFNATHMNDKGKLSSEGTKVLIDFTILQ